MNIFQGHIILIEEYWNDFLASPHQCHLFPNNSKIPKIHFNSQRKSIWGNEQLSLVVKRSTFNHCLQQEIFRAKSATKNPQNNKILDPTQIFRLSLQSGLFKSLTHTTASAWLLATIWRTFWRWPLASAIPAENQCQWYASRIFTSKSSNSCLVVIFSWGKGDVCQHPLICEISFFPHL